jgi:lipopolysaccharide/colanic/teichoic acid biosynthesis glycosyltransferase
VSIANARPVPSMAPVSEIHRDDELQEPFEVTPYLALKNVGERLLAAFLLIPAIPVMACLVVIIRITSRGPAIFSQTRVGKHGRIYTMHKLRSMRVDAEQGTGAIWASGKDPRVTRVGYWLRKLHLDELPQLFNVLRGEMALLGPRPERPEFVEILAEQIPDYRHRLSVLPGITGLAQINLPPDQTLNDVRRKLILDLEYIQKAGLWIDLRMLACTFLRVIGVPGGAATRLTCVQRYVSLETDALSGKGSSQIKADTKNCSAQELLLKINENDHCFNGNLQSMPKAMEIPHRNVALISQLRKPK